MASYSALVTRITFAKNVAHIPAHVCPLPKLLQIRRKAKEAAPVAVIIVFAVRRKALNHGNFRTQRSSDPEVQTAQCRGTAVYTLHCME